MKRVIRNLIIGKGVYIESRNEYRQVMLSGHYALLALVIIFFYLILDLPYGFTQSVVVFSFAFVLIAYSLVLHRLRNHCLANYILFPTLNLLLFLISSSESKETGSFIFFIPISLGAFAVFNYAQRKVAVSFAVLSFVFFAISVVGNYSFLPFRNYPETYQRYSLIINFMIAFPVCVMAVYLLITLNQYSSRQLIESNKQLEKLNDELDRFVYSTSHDLRAPLLSVLGLLKLAENTSELKEMQNYHRMMSTRMSALDKFIKDITDYSRNNRLQIVQENVHLAPMIDEIWESLKYSSDARGIEFVNDIPSHLVIINDPTRLQVVLSNLIANAIRYHDQRKERKYIRIHHLQTPTSFSVYVEDNGQGIAPEFQAKVFEMFYRGNESSQGSGLGLYIVKETLAKLSGTVHLTSTPRQGSTFAISMPVLAPIG
ncbi:MAG: GHKL domain-containing protein [Bacteroidetes bacterium]|nr:GHKL domain-containing protein [Bacteroidota bacterium]